MRKDLLVLMDLLALLVPLDLRVLLDNVVWSVFPVREEKEASLVFLAPLVNLANKVLLDQVVNAVPLAPWGPLDWLVPLVNLDVRDPLVLKAPLEGMVLPGPRVTVVRLAPLAPLVPLVLPVLPALLVPLARMAIVVRLVLLVLLVPLALLVPVALLDPKAPVVTRVRQANKVTEA